jgi:hypothetical protein
MPKRLDADATLLFTMQNLVRALDDELRAMPYDLEEAKAAYAELTSPCDVSDDYQQFEDSLQCADEHTAWFYSGARNVNLVMTKLIRCNEELQTMVRP